MNITLNKLCFWLIWLPNYLFRFSEWGGSDGELPHLFVGLLTNDQYTLFLVGLLHIVGWWDFERQHKVWTAHCLCCSHRLEGGQRGCLECCLSPIVFSAFGLSGLSEILVNADKIKIAGLGLSSSKCLQAQFCKFALLETRCWWERVSWSGFSSHSQKLEGTGSSSF